MNVLLLPHQDDEFFCLPKIRDICSKGEGIVIFFLTDGCGKNVKSTIRNLESKSVLEKEGVCCSNIHFIGELLSVPDGSLHKNTAKVYDYLINCVDWHSVKTVYFPCYEGGHQDHDAVSYLVSLLSSHTNAVLYQFPTYTAYKTPSPFFNVFKHIREQRLSNNLMNYRWSDLRSILKYRSQFTTWLGLLPVVLLSFLKSKIVYLVLFDSAYLKSKPHEGKLLYERMGRISYDSFKEEIDKQVKECR